MILADALGITINLLLVAHVVISLLLILVVLMQRPKQEGLGAAFGGGMTDQMFGAQTTNVLQKGTVYLGAAFLILSLVLAILIGNQNYTKAIDEPAPEKVEEAPAVPDPVPVPTSEGGGSIKDELEKTDGTIPVPTPGEGEATPTPGGVDSDAPGEPVGEEDTGGPDTPVVEGGTPAPDPSGDSGSSTPGEGTDPGGDEATEGATPTGDPVEDKPE